MRFAIGDPVFDRLAGRLDGLDIEWRRWRVRELDEAPTGRGGGGRLCGYVEDGGLVTLG